MSSALPDPIRTFLSDFVARRRRFALVKAGALALAMFLAVLLICCTVDRLVHLSRAVRGVLLLADLVAVVLILRRPLIDALRPHANWFEASAQVEAIDSAFAQRLMTVTSQIQSSPSHRGSSGMLAALMEEVSAVASQKRGAELISFGFIRRSITLAGCFISITLATFAVPWLQMPRLIGRFARPWAHLAPVTTTQLDVTPGSIAALQGRPLRVSVVARSLDDSPVELHVRQGDEWLVTQLEASDSEHFTGETPLLDRDTRYYITGGDARSETYDIHVLTVPGLKEIRARMEYPPYLHWPGKSTTMPDGKLEVPVGTELTLSLVGTESLVDAALVGHGGQRELTSASVDPSVRVARLQVKKDVAASIVLKSSQGVEQKIAQPLAIRSIPDRPPMVRLLTPTEDLRLTPLDLLTTAAQVLDDYGVESLNLQIKINDRTPTYQSILITGDRRRIEQVIDCDLAQFAVEPGDLVQIVLQAKDGAGQQTGSDVLRVTISPRSFDLNDFLRLADLKAASKMADELMLQLNAAREAIGQSPDSIMKDGDKSLQSLAAASQTARLLSIPLLRANTRANAVELGDSIGNWVDAAEQCRSISEELQNQRARKVEPTQIALQLDKARERIDTTNSLLRKAIRREQAIAIRNDATTALELQQRSARVAVGDREKLQNAAKRLQSSAQAGAQSLGVSLMQANGTLPELDAVINDAATAMQGNPRVDYAGVAREWQGVLQQASAGNLLVTRSALAVLALEDRLAMASQAESIRPGADFVRARDGLLSSRAARMLSASSVTPVVPDSIRAAVSEYPAALAELQAEHAMHCAKQTPGDTASILAKAQAAREKMRRWAGDDAKLAPQLASLEAAAAMQDQKFEQAIAMDQARALDSQSANAPSKNQQKLLERQTAVAQQLKKLAERQKQLAQQTAELISKADDPAAGRQMQSLNKQQQQLASAVQQARREQTQKSQTPDEQKTVDPVEVIADLRSELAELRRQNASIQTQKGEAEKLSQAKNVDPSSVDVANQKLVKIAPIADDAQRQIDDQVIGGARQVQQEARGKNAVNVAQKSIELEAAIQTSMKKLNAAEEKLADRDAMAAAEAAAKQAADEISRALGEKPKSAQASQQSSKGGQGSAGQSGQVSEQDRAAAMAAAIQAQERTVASLDRAVNRSAAGAGQSRVRELPLSDSLFSLLPALIDGTGAGPGVSASAKIDAPAAREWGRLKPREDQNQTAVTTPADPAGYEQPLRWYFEALGRKSGPTGKSE